MLFRLKSFFISIYLLFISFVVVQAQEMSADLFVGAMNYQGDLAGNVVEFSETNPAFGASFKYLMYKDIALRGSVLLGKISGDDANSEELASRGLSFESQITELTLTVEYHPFGRGRWNRRNELIKSFSPYIYAGVGYSFGNPEVQGLPTNSEDLLNDKNARLIVPFGAGVQWTFSEQFYVGFEAGTRYLNDDYLDGVSQAGNPAANDWYISAGFRIGYFLSGEPSMF